MTLATSVKKQHPFKINVLTSKAQGLSHGKHVLNLANKLLSDKLNFIPPWRISFPNRGYKPET